MNSMSHAPTVRAMVKHIQQELMETDLPATRASELLQQATALMGNCRDAVRKCESDYNAVELQAFQTHQAQNRARLVAKNSPEWLALREAQDVLKTNDDLMMSLRRIVSLAESELRAMR